MVSSCFFYTCLGHVYTRCNYLFYYYSCLFVTFIVLFCFVFEMFKEHSLLTILLTNIFLEHNFESVCSVTFECVLVVVT